MTLLTIYFTFVLDYGNDVRQKQIWAIFLFEFKMGCKAAETTCNINRAFAPGAANEWTVHWWFKRFHKDESLGDEQPCGAFEGW